jgi:lon-related putative ATP-dependent protease
MLNELTVDKLRWICDPQALGCSTSQEMQTLETIIGQERAVRSLKFGLDISQLGFNIFVSGLSGTGKTTTVERFVEEVAQDKPVPDDWCYVINFRDPYRPRALRLPPGRARQFQADMKSLVDRARKEMRIAFESEEYGAKRQEVVRSFEQQREQILAQVDETAQRQGFFIQATPIGLLTVPIKDGKPLADEEFMALDRRDKEEISEKREALQAEVAAAMRQAKGVERGIEEALAKLDQEVALFAVGHLIQDLLEKYQDLQEVVTHLGQVQEDMLANLAQFRTPPEAQQEVPAPFPGARDVPLRKYEVNLLVDNSKLEGAPVIIELNPTHDNLTGRVEQEARFGALVTDFTLIREGCLHRANGGYLVVPVDELLRNPLAWDSLKRALRNKQIVIEDVAERLGFFATRSLRPEPILLDVKVILIGQPELYYALRAFDEDFSELFKVRADFDSQMDRTAEHIQEYAAFVCTVCEDENLKHLDNLALAKIIEHGSRLAEDQEKLSTRFGEIADVIREASYYATQDGTSHVTAAHVKQAIDERFYRSSLIRDRINEMISRGTIMIDVTGERVGQVNGLSVMDLGDISFGRPSRITASIGLGQEGLVDIEREAKLGGPIHSKGVMILAGYLTDKYARDKPLSLTARLVFEQSYSGVEGDSASSTELYTLLSALAELPTKQGIAVTGSVNQKGEVQAIGGANQKVEGFFEVCRAKGLTGEQGVMIPVSNVPNLMLKEEILEAVQEGRFHVWPVKTIDEGIEILTGVWAGQRREDGTFEEGTVNARVEDQLRQLAETMRAFGRVADRTQD